MIKERSKNHFTIINNTVDNLDRLKVIFNENGIRNFLLSTRFLFQGLDRVRFYDLNGELIGDTNILDLDQNVFTRSEDVIEESINGEVREKEEKINILKESNKDLIKKTILNEYNKEPITISEINQNNLFVSTLSKIRISEIEIGYIAVTEEANDILNAVKERKDFIIRTVLAVV